MTATLDTQFQQDQTVWDRCSSTYEHRVVGGHPDVCAYEEFEETLIDHLLLHLTRTLNIRISVVDLGCGSGRLMLRLAAQTTSREHLKPQTAELFHEAESRHPAWAWNPLLQDKLQHITGVDFSRAMLDLAREKFVTAGLSQVLSPEKISMIHGSAFEPIRQPDGVIPVVVCLVNSIGVMQGMEGARKLFQAIRQTVEPHGGIGLISCFCRENIRSHALGQYESTMDVSGPPIWLKSDRYDLSEHLFVPLSYRRYDDPSQTIDVGVYDRDGGKSVDPCHPLYRIPERVEKTIGTGEIHTHQGYKSRWYSRNEISELIAELWGGKGWQAFGSHIDPLRARAAQLAWCDPAGHARKWFQLLMGETHRG